MQRKIQNEEDLQAYKKNLYYGNNTLSMPSNLRVGDHMYEDVNKDGKLTQDDLVFLGTDDPKVTFAFDLGLEWRGFDVSAIFFRCGTKNGLSRCRLLESSFQSSVDEYVKPYDWKSLEPGKP